MAFEIELETGYAAEVDGTPVVGRCRILAASQRLAYSAAHTRAQDADDVAEVFALIDQWVAKVLVTCDATVSGVPYQDLGAEDQSVYVEHLPVEAKQAIITRALGLSDLDVDGAEGNDSDRGPSSG